MLVVSESSYNRLMSDRATGLARRIDPWIAPDVAGWPQIPQRERIRLLADAVQAGRIAGMRVESDFALFCLLVMRQRERLSALDDPRVREALGEVGVNAPSKLMRLSILWGEKV